LDVLEPRGLAVRIVYKTAFGLAFIALVSGAVAAADQLHAVPGEHVSKAAAQQPAAAVQRSTPTSTARPTTPRPTTTTPPPPPPPPVTTQPPPPPPPPPPKPKPKPAPSIGSPCNATARACIDLSANQSWLLEGGRVIYGPVPITHGRPGYLTPPGSFNVTFKNIDHRSSIFNNAPMPYSVFFNGGIAFHEGSLSELSHGCIHLSRAAAQTYFNTLHRGDIVQVVP
jgi:lipoprotein-anchoring transpeptidase ErfK/SrfK